MQSMSMLQHLTQLRKVCNLLTLYAMFSPPLTNLLIFSEVRKKSEMDNLPVPQLELHWSLPARPWCSQDTLGRTVTPVRDYHSLPWLQVKTFDIPNPRLMQYQLNFFRNSPQLRETTTFSFLLLRCGGGSSGSTGPLCERSCVSTS